jgi:hypothetical protein
MGKPTKTTPSTKPTQALDAVLEHQKAVSQISSSIFAIDTLITARRNDISQANAAIPDISHLARERENILADIAIGQKTDEDLAEFDQRSEAEKEEYRTAKTRAQRVIHDSEQAISGLNRKVSEAIEKRADLQSKEKALIKALLLEEAEVACASYVEAAQVVKEQYVKLVALDSLLQHNGGPSIYQHRTDISLPSFNLKQCDDVRHKNWTNILFATFLMNASDGFQQATQSMLEEIRSAGVTLI